MVPRDGLLFSVADIMFYVPIIDGVFYVSAGIHIKRSQLSARIGSLSRHNSRSFFPLLAFFGFNDSSSSWLEFIPNFRLEQSSREAQDLYLCLFSLRISGKGKRLSRKHPKWKKEASCFYIHRQRDLLFFPRARELLSVRYFG